MIDFVLLLFYIHTNRFSIGILSSYADSSTFEIIFKLNSFYSAENKSTDLYNVRKKCPPSV